MLFESRFVLFLALADVFLAVFEHATDELGELVRGCGDGFGRAVASSDAAVEGAEGGVVLVQGLGEGLAR